MGKLTDLQVVLLDEYYRRERTKEAYKQAISKCVKGKLIREIKDGKLFHYLRWKENGEIKLRELDYDECVSVSASIQEREELEESLSQNNRDRKMLIKALGKKLIEEYRNKW